MAILRAAVLLAIFCISAIALDTSPLQATGLAKEHMIFAVIVTRHGVRSISRVPPQYEWPDWRPVADGKLTAHGYSLMSYMGEFYRQYFVAHGLPPSCRKQNVYVYTDTDQRTVETARALIRGICGRPGGLELYQKKGASIDPLFDAQEWLLARHRIDTRASLYDVRNVAKTMTNGDYSGLQRLLDARCSKRCTPPTSLSQRFSTSRGLSRLDGPLSFASTYAEDIFLEYAQCRPEAEIAGADFTRLTEDLQSAMRLHVLAYRVNYRSNYNASVRAGTLFAHIVSMLDEKAGIHRVGVDNPAIPGDVAAIFSAHDTQLGALSGILQANWRPRHGIVADDMPPGGALVFELYMTPKRHYRVRIRFAFETLQQFRSYSYRPGGILTTTVRFEGCARSDCSVPLRTMQAWADGISRKGFVRKAWSATLVEGHSTQKLQNPVWTHCRA